MSSVSGIEILSEESKKSAVEEEASTLQPHSSTNIGLQLKAMKSRLNLNLESLERNAKTCIPPLTVVIDTATERDNDNYLPNPFECFYKHYRDKLIQNELELIFLNSQDGIHVVPSCKSLQIWFGVIFVKEGPYNEGIFHFNIFFRDSFPETRPVLRFKSKIFHPQIDQNKGTLNLKNVYNKRRHVPVWELLRHTRSYFYSIDVKDSFNSEASHLFTSNIDKFNARCRASVLDSLLEYEEQIYDQSKESENPFFCSILDKSSLQGVKKIMLSMNYEVLKESSVIEWAKNHLGKVLNNISSAY